MEEMHGHPLHFFVSIPLQFKTILLMGVCQNRLILAVYRIMRLLHGAALQG